MLKLNQSINQSAYDSHQNRERHCALWLKSLHKPVQRPLSMAVLAGACHGVLIISQAALLASILHQVVINRQVWQSGSNALILLLAIILLRGACVYAGQVCGFAAAERIQRQLRRLLLDHWAKLGPAQLKHQHSGQLATVTLEQCMALEKYFSRYVPQQRIAAIVPGLILLAVFPVNWVVGVIFIMTGPLVPVFMALIGVGAAAASRSQFQELAWMGGFYLDRLQGLITLKLFGQAYREAENIGRIADAFRIKTMKVLRIAFMSSAALELFSAVAVALVAVYVGLGLLGLIQFGPAGQITLREALFVLLLAPEFFQPLRQLAVNYHDRAAALGASDFILEQLEHLSEQADKFSGSESCYVIELIGVSKLYQQRMILKDINLRIGAGEKVALTGETGTGKSTLLNILSGFEQVSGGQALINGRAISRETAIRQISWLGQRAAIFYGSIAENISLFDPDIPLHRINAAAHAAGVMQFAAQLEDGLDTLVGEQGHGLSGGQVQRIALARVLLKDAPVVLLDEPTANLDRNSKERLLDSIAQLLADKTVIIASHDPLVVARMERHLTLRNGTLQ